MILLRNPYSAAVLAAGGYAGYAPPLKSAPGGGSCPQFVLCPPPPKSSLTRKELCPDTCLQTNVL